MKKLIKKYFSNLAYFYSYLGTRVLWLFLLTMTVGLLDGFGLTMFLPLLKMVDGGNVQGEVDGLGKLAFLVNGIQSMGIKITLSSVLIFMFSLFLLKGIGKYFSGYYRVVVQQYFIKKLRLKILNTFNRMSFMHYLSSDVGRIQNAMSGEVERVARAFNLYFYTFEQAVLVFVYVGFAFFVDLKFAALVTVGGMLTNIMYNRFYKLTKIASLKLTNHSNQYQGQIIQHVGNFKYLKATALVNQYAQKLKATIQSIEKHRQTIGMYSAFLQAAREPMIIGVVVLIIFLQVSVLGGDLGPILISLIFFYRALTSLTSMQTNWNKFLEVSGSMENVKTFQAFLQSSVDENGSTAFTHFKERISIRDLSFRYNTRPVLQHISLDINRNDVVAFVGESGSGKTTLINILSGLLPVSPGTFLIDGVDRRELDISTYQKKIGYVTQEPIIFNDSIFNNITFWAEPTPEHIARFWMAVENASLKEYVLGLQEKEQAMLGINGINVSGGQKQRINIARALYRNPEILILDEATSALDTQSERKVQQALDTLRQGRTAFVIAHRLSTIENADRIVVLDRGRIVEIGPHAELLAHNGRYASLYRMQADSFNATKLQNQ